MDMRRLLGSVVPAVLLVALPLGGLSACGDDEGGTATDDAASTTSQQPSDDGTDGTDDPDGKGGESVDHELVQMVTETAAGGEASPVAVPLGDDEAVAAFTAQFETDTMRAKVQQAVDAVEVPDGMALYGAVVAVGCDVPTDVVVTDTDAGLLIGAQKVPNPMKECFAPMTTVALVLVPASAA